jgi:hypothetical protein
MTAIRSLTILCAALVGLSACSDPETERIKKTTLPTYDSKTGRLAEFTYDNNKHGRIDTWTDMDGTRPLRSRMDLDEDGKIDRWEYYDDKGALTKVGFSRKKDGKVDAWAFARADGKVDRIEMSSTADERKIDRWEHYDPTKPGVGPNGEGALVRSEEDTNADGKPDKWETYANGGIESVAFDENADGRPDRRLTYRGGDLVLVESEPDASGAFTKRVAVK